MQKVIFLCGFFSFLRRFGKGSLYKVNAPKILKEIRKNMRVRVFLISSFNHTQLGYKSNIAVSVCTSTCYTERRKIKREVCTSELLLYV
jgi:hypothetical protein